MYDVQEFDVYLLLASTMNVCMYLYVICDLFKFKWFVVSVVVPVQVRYLYLY